MMTSRIQATFQPGILRLPARLLRLRRERFFGSWKLLAALLLATLPALAQTTATNVETVVADFNHDGLPDLLTLSATSTGATILFGTLPYGTFNPTPRILNLPIGCNDPSPSSGGYYYGAIPIGDFNGDGIPDFFVSCTSQNATSTSAALMLGNGDGTFTASSATFNINFFSGGIVADFNKDGKADLVLLAYPNGQSGTNNQSPALYFYAGNGDGTFAAPVVSPLGASTTFQPGNYLLSSPVAADIDGDGYPDILLNAAYGYSGTSYNGATLTVSVFGNRKDGTFGAINQATRIPDANVAIGAYPSTVPLKVGAGHFTSLTSLDLIVADTGSTPGYDLVKNNSTAGNFSLGTAVKTNYPGLQSLLPGTFTASGYTDLAASDGAHITALVNNGTGTFSKSYASLSLASSALYFAVADANNDGYSDIYTASTLNNNVTPTVSLVTGTATATSAPFSLPLGTAALSATWPGNVNFNGSTATGSQTVNGSPVTLALTSSKNPSNTGDTVTFTATVTPNPANATLPTGTISILVDNTVIGQGQPAANGTLTASTSTLTTGRHTVTANFTGDPFYAGAPAAPLTQTVNQPPAVAPTITWSPGPINVGTALSATQLNAVATNATGATVPGAYAYTPAAGTILSTPGSQVLSVTFTPTDLVTYKVASLSVPITVLPATQSPLTANLLLNPGAELGLVNGAIPNWTPAGPGSPTIDNGTDDPGINPHTGAYDFVGYSGASDSLSQTVSLLSSTITATLLDSGTVSANLSFWEQGLNQGTPSDDASVTLTFLNATGATLSSVTTAVVDSHNSAWQNFTGTYPVPAGTRSITYTMNFIRNAGSFLDAFIDDNSLILTTPPPAAATTTTLALTLAGKPVTSVASGTPVTLTATVLAGTTPVTPGQVNFCDASATTCTDTHLLGTAQLTSTGTATLKFIPGIGIHTYKAVFLGTKTNAAGTSSAQPLTVTGSYPTQTTITSTGTAAAYTLTGTVVGTGSATVGPTGTLSFLNTTRNNASLGTVILGTSVAGLTFKGITNATTGENPQTRSVVGDFNGDGIPDIATANTAPDENPTIYANTVTIALGKGDGTFTTVAAHPATGIYPQSIAVGDFNGDGKLDLATANENSHSVTVLLGNGDGTFTAAPSPALGITPYGVVVADFNGDGNLDLAVSGFNGIAILLGNGDGTFTLLSTSITGSLASIVTADFNGDGKPDLAVQNYYPTSEVMVLLGKGDGTFTQGTPILFTSTGSNLNGIAVGDFNGDGIPDMAVTNSAANAVNILTGKGDGTFTSSIATAATNKSPEDVRTADFNGDGKLDLAIVNFGESTARETILLGNGDGTFTSSAISTGVSAYGAVAVADFNGDGVPDLVSNYGSTFYVALTQRTQTATATLPNVSILGLGTYQGIASYPGDANDSASASTPISLSGVPLLMPVIAWTPTVATIPYGTALGPQQLDAAATNAAGTAILGTFTYTPAAGAILPVGQQTLSVTFVPADTATYATATATATITVQQATGISATLAITSGGATVSTVNSGTVVSLTATVLNGTLPVTPGQVNFCDASAPYCTDIHLLGTAQLSPAGQATFNFVPSIGAHTYKAVFLGTTNVATATTANGALTVTGKYATTTTIAQSGTAGIYTLTSTTTGFANPSAFPTGTTSFIDTSNAGTVLATAPLGAAVKGVTFGVSGSPTTGSGYLAVATGDFNGDGKPDVAVSNRNSNTVTLMLGKGDGTFTVASITPTGTMPQFIATGDFNGDGKLDIATANINSYNISVLLGNGDGTFTPATSPATGGAPSGITVGDFNGDGIADIATTTQNPNVIKIFLGKGDGTFTSLAAAPAIGSTAFSVVTGDLNGDGKADLVVSNFNSNSLTVLLGNGDGTFTAAPTITGLTNPIEITLGDFNGDGKPDIAVPNYTNKTISVFLGVGDGTFTNGPTITVGTNPYAVATGDFNGDGILDLAVPNAADNTVSLLVGNGDGTFTATSPIAVGGFPSFIAIADFNGDGDTDLAIANQGTGPAVSILLAQLTQTATATAAGISPIGAGTHQIIASYPGDTNFASSTSTPIPLAVQQIPTATTLTSSLNPSPAATNLTFTAIIAPAASNGITATGSVIFTDGTNPLATVTLSATGTVTFTTTTPLTPGTHVITAVYSGDANFATSTSNLISEVVTPARGLTFSTRNLAFGNQTVGTTSAPQSVLISNLTGVTINIADFLLVLGPSPSDFTQTNNCPAAFPANATCTLNIAFAPHGVGLKNAGVEIDDDSNPSSQSVNFTGTGTGGILQVNPGNLKNIAGNGTAGYTGDNGLATAAELNLPAGVAVDPTGIVYIADELNNVVRKVDLSGNITTFAGTGVSGYTGDGGPATAATLYHPATVTLDTAGNLYIFDDGNNVVRKVDLKGIITTFAGTGTAGYAGDGGPATSALLNQPQGGKFDKLGNLYIPDCVGSNLRKVDTKGIITTVAGTGTAGFSGDGGQATNAQLFCPSGVDIDASGNLYIADDLNNRIRKVDTQGIITTIAGDGTAAYNGDNIAAATAELNLPNDLALDAAGNLYIADSGNNRIRKIDISGTITTVAGGLQNAGSAGVNTPLSLTIAPSGNLYFVDSENNAVREFFPAGASPFPSTPIGTPATPQTLTISNIGNVATTIASAQSFTLTGNAADFSLSGGSCMTGATLAANGGSCTLQIAFTPTALGLRTLNVSIADTALNSPQSFTISGTGATATPTITWTPTPATIPYGTPLSTQQLNAVATTPNGTVVPGAFAYTPAINTILPAGQQTVTAVFTPSATGYTTASATQIITVTQATPTLAWATPAPIAQGTALSATQLNATATGITGAALPGAFVYNPAAGTVPAAGTQTLSVTFTPTDTVDYTTATRTVQLTVTGITLTSFTPNTASLGDPAKTITLTGTGFTPASVAQVNGASIATTYVTPTTLTAVVPAPDFAAVGTLTVTVVNPATSSRTQALPLTVTAPTPSVTLTGPSTTQPSTQPALALTVANPYPVPLTATFTLSFTSAVTPTVDDPAIQFANGGRTFTFTVPANSTTVPAVQIQAGTVAGTITVPVTLTAAGVNVTPATVRPLTIVVPAAVPAVTTATITRGTGSFTVTIHGFSNTREVATAAFHFLPATGAQIDTPDVTIPVATIFSGWFTSAASTTYGSTFTYTQVFNVSDTAASIGSVQITLTNSVGVSTTYTAQ